MRRERQTLRGKGTRRKILGPRDSSFDREIEIFFLFRFQGSLEISEHFRNTGLQFWVFLPRN